MAKEGIGTIALLLCAALILSVGASVATGPYILILTIVVWIFVLFSLYFFRDPKRYPPSQPGSILSPADGKVRSIETVKENEFLHSSAVHLVINLSLFDVHITRSPVDGMAEYFKYQRGHFHVAYRSDAGVTNEQTVIGIGAPFAKIMLKQIAGKFARRIVCHIREGDAVTAGQKIGMIKFGSRVDIYLPTTVRLCIAKGDLLRAGESKLGTIPYE